MTEKVGESRTLSIKRLKAILEGIGDGISIVDKNMRIVWVNDILLKRSSCNLEDLKGRFCYEAYHHKAKICENCPSIKTFKTGKILKIIQRGEDGKYYEITTSPIRNEEDKIIEVLELSRDVTEKVKAEEALKESEEKYRTIFWLSPEAIVILDTRGNILEMNERVYSWFGYKAEKIIGENILKLPFLPKESKSKVMEKFSQRMLGKEVLPYELDFKTKRGKRKIGKIIGTPMRDKNGKIIGDLVMISDITKEKIAEESLKESEEKYRTIFNETNDSIVLIDALTGKFLDFNKNAYRGLGYTKKEFSEMGIKDIEAKESRKEIKYHINKVLKKGHDTFETKHKKKDGSLVDMEVSANVINLRGKKVLLSIWRNITERKKIDRLRREIEEAKEVDRLKDEFLGMISHELKTPLVSMTSLTQTLSKELSKFSNEEQKKDFALILDDARKLNFIISNILELTRIRSKEAGLKKRKIQVNKLIGEVLSVIEKLARSKDIKIERKLSKRIPKVTADKNKIGVVITNLLDNAIKFTPKNGKIKIETKKEKKDIVISVSDTGVGIEKDKLNKIFDRFYQIDSEFKYPYSGIGLGLALCKEIVNAHNGKIWVKSKRGKGSTFYFSLPM
jgi:PAS domain S-box-containing protein